MMLPNKAMEATVDPQAGQLRLMAAVSAATYTKQIANFSQQIASSFK
jgi:hypothetical protein